MAYAKDPVCGMEVETSTDLKFEYEGETYYFCSRGCKLDFEDDPEKFLDPEYQPAQHERSECRWASSRKSDSRIPGVAQWPM
jgi:YHS domain-containing protein